MPTKLGQHLKQLRESAEVSQKVVAEKFGYESPQFVSNWERGTSKPPVTAIKKLASIYKTNAEDLFEVVLESHLEKIRTQLYREFSASKAV